MGQDPPTRTSAEPDSAPIHATHELLARAFEAAPNGFVMVDASGCIVAANAELETMFGYARGALIGLSVDALLPADSRTHHADWRSNYIRAPEPRAMGAGRVLYGCRRDGSNFAVEIGLNPLVTETGTLVLASVVDVSERVALESAFRGLFESSPLGLLIVNDDGRIEMVNSVLAESLGYTVSGMRGLPLSDLLPMRYRPGHDGLTQAYRRTGERRMMGQGRDLTALHADGAEVPVEVGLSRVRWQRQAMTLAVVTDISVRKRLEQDLQQANANLEEFTYVASHDLRSPLRGISDLVEWISADLGNSPPAGVQRNLDRISQRIQRMERLIGDLLNYARAGRDATEHVEVNLDVLVRGILEMQPVPPGIEVHCECALPGFRAARVPLETVLRNLIANAIKHHDTKKGTLAITARVLPDDCEICVTDDGPGVPKAAHERVFKLFQTLATGERGGGGIGLALSKRLAEAHGGHIELVSPVSQGRGACFKVRWPRFPKKGAP